MLLVNYGSFPVFWDKSVEISGCTACFCIILEVFQVQDVVKDMPEDFSNIPGWCLAEVAVFCVQ